MSFLHRFLRKAEVVLLCATGIAAAAPPLKPAATTAKETTVIDASKLPKAKQTTLGLYVTAAQAYAMWQAAPDKVKVIDVRTPEEFAFVGHPAMAWNVPIAFVTYQRKDGRFEYAPKMNAEFVNLVREIAQPAETLLVTCRSGGRSAMAVNQLAAAGFTHVYNIVDGVEGDAVNDPGERLPRQADEERLEELGALGLRHRSREGDPRGRQFQADKMTPCSAVVGGPPMVTRRAKRTLNRENFLRTVANVLASSPVLAAALFRPKTSAALREKVVLAVTAINDCALCAWGHSHWAMANGVPLEEVNQILGGQIESLAAANPAEAAAILFAQHYAEEHDRVDPESLENLRRYFSTAQAEEILAYVRAITFGNLCGNTLQAVRDRLRGGRRAGGGREEQ